MTISSASLQSRFQVLQSAIAAPGSCVTCGGSQGPFIDFGFLAEYYGALIFCVPCAQDCGRSAGLVDPTPVADNRTLLDVSVISNQALHEVEAEIVAALGKFRGIIELSNNGGFFLESEAQISDTRIGKSEVSDSKKLGTSNPDVESSGSEGSDGVSSATGNDDSVINDV